MVGTRGRNATKESRNIAVALHSSDDEGMYNMYDNEEEQEGEEGSLLQPKTNARFGLKMDDDNDDDDNDEIMSRGQRYSTITDHSDPMWSDSDSEFNKQANNQSTTNKRGARDPVVIRMNDAVSAKTCMIALNSFNQLLLLVP